MQTIKTGVLVIGGGGAAARAALEARLAGADVLLATKGRFGSIGARGAGATGSGFSATSAFATPGWTGALSEREKRIAHMIAADPVSEYKNVIQAGLGMAEPALVKALISDAIPTRKALMDWGVTFDELGMRSHGAPIMAALAIQLRKCGVAVRDNTMIVRLIVRNGECAGAVAVDENSGEIFAIEAAATVIATGGDANLFMLNLNPPDTTGDGYVLGYEAGAELMNLEFKQIFLGTVFPTRNMLTQALPKYTKLTNARGEEFLPNYLPAGATAEECLAQRNGHNPFSTRDKLSRYVDIAILSEIKAGRGAGPNGVFLDRSDPRIPAIQPAVNEYWTYRGIDFTRPVEVGICHHCSLGGLKIDENAETSVPRLFAAGEAAAGPHGADRMGGHMLLAAQVFGARAGRKGAAYARTGKHPETENGMMRSVEAEVGSLAGNKTGADPSELKRSLQRSAYFKLLVTRRADRLNEFLDEVRQLREQSARLSVNSPRELIDALELRNLLKLAEIEARVCLERKESRGPHYREDYPQQDDKNWLKSIVVKKAGELPDLTSVALDPEWRDFGDDKIGYWG